MWWLVGFLGLIAVGVACVIYLRHSTKGEDTGKTAIDMAPPPRMDAISSETPAAVTSDKTQTNSILKAARDRARGTPDQFRHVGEEVEDQTAAITDFAPEDDSLLFIWDDSANATEPPKISIEADPEKAGELQVWMGDRVLAQVSGQSALTAAEIALIPLSSAQALDLVQR